MDNQDEFVSCCFRCSEKSQNTNIQFPPLTQNAFPGLVGKDWRFAKTQPFIRAYYCPTVNFLPPRIKDGMWQNPLLTIHKKRQQKQSTSRAKPTLNDLNDFDDWYIWHHEFAHLAEFYKTPAKDLARLHLAYAYDSIFSLGQAKTSSEMVNAWNRFQEAERQLGKIHNNIAFVEELFATAHALKQIGERDIAPEGLFAGFQEQFEELKQRVLQREEMNFPKNAETGFPGYTAVYNRIEPHIQAIFAQPILIMAFLQAIELSSLWTNKYSMRFYSLDAKESLDDFLKIVENTSNMEEAIKLLEPRFMKIFEAWRELIGLMHMNTLVGLRDNVFLSKEIPELFWLVSYGQSPIDSVYFNSAKEYGHFTHPSFLEHLRSNPQEFHWLLRRAAYRGQSYISRSYVSYDLPSPPMDILNAHTILLLFEGIRQQIEARKGIICPYNECRQRCRCSKEQHDDFLQLSHFAQDGFFGDGDWSLLPCRL